MIQTRLRLRNLISLGLSIVILASIYLVSLAAHGALTRPGWSGAQNYLSLMQRIIFYYLLWLGFYLCLRSWITLRIALFGALTVLSVVFFLPSLLTQNYTSEIAVLVFACMLGYGSTLDRFLSRFGKIGWISWPIFGNILIVTIIHILDALKILNSYSVILMILVGVVFFLKEMLFNIKTHNISDKKITDKSQRIAQDSLAVLIFPLLLFGFASNGPDMQFDSLAMKAWLPRQWHVQDSIFLVVDHLQSGVLGSGAYFLFQGNYLGTSNIGPQFQYLSLLFITGILISAGAKSKKLPLAALLAYLFVTIPANLWQVSGAYDDLWLTLLATSGIFTIITFFNSNNQSGKVISIVAGVVSASLFLGKLSLLPFVIVGLLSPLFFPKPTITKLKLLVLTQTWAVFIVSISIPMLWRWLSYGNPVWPLYNGIFHAKSLPQTNEHFNLPMGPFSFRDLILAPITSFFRPEFWVEGGSIGLFSFALASGYLGVTFLFRKKFNFAVFIVGILALLFLINWWLNFRYLRYTLPIMPLVLITLVSKTFQMSRLLSEAKILILLLLISFPALVAIPTGNPASPDRIPFNTIVGIETTEQYQMRGMPSVVVINWLNANASPNAKIAGSGSVFYQRLLLRSDLDIFYDWEVTPQNSEKIEYVLIYRPITSSTLEGMSTGKCLIQSFNDQFDLYGVCK
jgi:hypothetical protein